MLLLRPSQVENRIQIRILKIFVSGEFDKSQPLVSSLCRTSFENGLLTVEGDQVLGLLSFRFVESNCVRIRSRTLWINSFKQGSAYA